MSASEFDYAAVIAVMTTSWMVASSCFMECSENASTDWSAPGIVAHESAVAGGERRDIPTFA